MTTARLPRWGRRQRTGAGRVAAEVQLPPAALDIHALVTATGAGPERPLELLKLVGVARSCSGDDPEYDFSGFFDPPDRILYSEHWLRRLGYRPRQTWQRG